MQEVTELKTTRQEAAGHAPEGRAWPTGFRGAGGTLGLNYGDFVTAAKDIFLRMGADFVAWWVDKVLERKDTSSAIKLADLAASHLELDSGKRGSLHFDFGANLPEITPDMLHIMQRCGYRYDAEKREFQRDFSSELRAPWQLVKLRGDYVDQTLCRIPEKQFTVPELEDPRIYQPHVGTSMLGATPAQERLEGLQDAVNVRMYLAAYNRLIAEPTVRHFFEATQNPYSGDSYRSCMQYITTEGASPDFVMLLHMGFMVQMASRCGGVLDKMEPIHRQMLGKLLEQYGQDHGS